MVKLSIVIVTYNSAKDIAACLESLRFRGSRAQEGNEFEIIVVDNASSDETKTILARFSDLRLVFNNKNLGYACANNQGVALARGEYLLFLNPDTILEPDAIDRLVDFLEQHPDVGAVAPRLLNPDGRQQLSIRSFPTFKNVLYEMFGLSRLFPGSRFGSWRLRSFDYNQPAFIEQPMASCLLIRRSVFTELGGFDERFPIYYNDVDLSFRMHQKGYKTAYLPQSRVYHKIGASTGPLKTKMIFENHRSLFRYLAKHNRSRLFYLKAILLLPLLEITALFRVFIYRLTRAFRRRAKSSV